MQIGLLLVASAAANSCGNPNVAFANSFSQNLKGEVCTNFGAKKYCYVECLAGYNQLAPIETKRTKINSISENKNEPDPVKGTHTLL